MPSVITFTSVLGPVASVKRILKPTFWPTDVLSSSPRREAIERAAIRRGCVCPIIPRTPRPTSKQIFGNCVDFPLPVSPHTTTTGCSRIAVPISSRRPTTGSVSS
jgi:hypothetical protein